MHLGKAFRSGRMLQSKQDPQHDAWPTGKGRAQAQGLKVETMSGDLQQVKHSQRVGHIAQQHLVCTGQSSCSAPAGANCEHAALSSLYQILAGLLSSSKQH